MPSYDRERTWSDVLERDAVLIDSLIARLPHQGHIAGVGRLEPPREEGGDSIPTDYTHSYQRAGIDGHTGSGRERRRASKGRSRPPLAAVGLERVGGLKGKGGGGRDTDVPERILNRGGEGGMASQSGFGVVVVVWDGQGNMARPVDAGGFQNCTGCSSKSVDRSGSGLVPPARRRSVSFWAPAGGSGNSSGSSEELEERAWRRQRDCRWRWER
jgi:hypothetical protein